MSHAGEPPSGSGSTPWRWVAGDSTGEVTVGRYTLTVGGPAGTVANPAAPEDRGDPIALRQALATDESEVERALDRVGQATGRVERAAQLVTDIAEGRILDPKALSREVDALVALLTRLDKEGKYSDVLRLARSLSVLLALLLRWTALVHTLRVALRAARALADVHAQGWALHELGTLGLGADDAKAATRDLHEARDLRARIDDQEGLAATNHNLELLRAAVPWYARPVVRRLAIAGAVAAIMGGIVALALGGGSKNEPPPASADTATSSTQATTTSRSTTNDTTSSSSTTAAKPTVTLEIQSAAKEPEGRTNLTFGGTAGSDPADGDVTVQITPRGGGTPQNVPAKVGADGRWSASTILALGGYTAVALQDYGAADPARSNSLSFSVRSGSVTVSTSTTSTTTSSTTTSTTTTSSTTSSGDVID